MRRCSLNRFGDCRLLATVDPKDEEFGNVLTQTIFKPSKVWILNPSLVLTFPDLSHPNVGSHYPLLFIALSSQVIAFQMILIAVVILLWISSLDLWAIAFHNRSWTISIRDSLIIQNSASYRRQSISEKSSWTSNKLWGRTKLCRNLRGNLSN